MSKQTTMSVSPETLKTWNELSERTKIPISTLVKEITENIQKQLDLLSPSNRLVFFSDLYIDKKTANLPKTVILIRLSDSSSFGFDSIPDELKPLVLKAFGYKRGKNGELIDTTEKEESK